MNGHEWAEKYETAIKRFQEFVKLAEDGTFQLVVEDGSKIGIDDTIFAQLKLSLEETNRKIRRGEIDSKQVELY